MSCVPRAETVKMPAKATLPFPVLYSLLPAPHVRLFFLLSHLNLSIVFTSLGPRRGKGRCPMAPTTARRRRTSSVRSWCEPCHRARGGGRTSALQRWRWRTTRCFNYNLCHWPRWLCVAHSHFIYCLQNFFPVPRSLVVPVRPLEATLFGLGALLARRTCGVLSRRVASF